MTIAEAREKCKGLAVKIPRDILVVLALILASSASFGLGFLAGQDAGQGSALPIGSPDAATGDIIASKNGTKYYLPGCSGVERVSDANRVYFATAAAAEAAGYSIASTCR